MKLGNLQIVTTLKKFSAVFDSCRINHLTLFWWGRGPPRRQRSATFPIVQNFREFLQRSGIGSMGQSSRACAYANRLENFICSHFLIICCKITIYKNFCVNFARAKIAQKSCQNVPKRAKTCQNYKKKI